ncbi:hemicentin-1-like isoform X2 [Mytilus galloprovincialis]|uniref:hemicentin-1-like isoform X2 n=1 Tax=Mytilus galloprovincialis TaxID=29158 RepID=UPI003F7B6713
MLLFKFAGIILLVYVNCSSEVCDSPGVCEDHGAYWFYHERCICNAGFTGTCCETNINECQSNPCQNRSICTDGENTYNCTCQRGFVGVHCEKNIDECGSNPCQYGGTCHDRVNGYTCSCKDGFHGANCETEQNECASNPCLNGATCVDLFNRYKCECLDGDSGIHCEIGPTVTSAPNIHLISEKTVLEGTHDLEIACYAEGIPAPVVSWDEIDAKFQPNVRQIGHFLVMENVTMADKAKNTRPFVAPLISAPATVLVKYYTDARLVCNVTGYPQPSVRWEFEKNRHIPGAKITGGMMFIPNVTKDATGLYTCIATNSIGSSRANIRLETTYDYPKILTSPRVYSGNAGTSHNFTCTATGHPIPRITWSFSSVRYKHNIILTLDQFKNSITKSTIG